MRRCVQDGATTCAAFQTAPYAANMSVPVFRTCAFLFPPDPEPAGSGHCLPGVRPCRSACLREFSRLPAFVARTIPALRCH